MSSSRLSRRGPIGRAGAGANPDAAKAKNVKGARLRGGEDGAPASGTPR
jgi:hypothetical protein